jgi:hypothetical protein
MDENNLPENDDTINAEAEIPVETEPEIENHATNSANDHQPEESMQDRLERLGGEPAPVITPDEFARLQQDGSVHIDSRGRVRTTRRQNNEPGVSLRKRRAWYQ